jgi:hypothetical protein
MNIDELKATHESYSANLSEWKKFKAAYSGTKALIDYGALSRNTRESDASYRDRKENAYGFNYTARIINIINSYIFQKPSGNDYGVLADDPFFQLFLDNADLQGKSFNHVINDLQRWCSVYGHIGLLIDKAIIDGTRTVSQDLSEKVYPFVTSYTPLNILDWANERINGRSVLSYIKLLDDDGNYRLWWADKWEVWVIIEDMPTLLNSGMNPLSEIPFIFMMNDESGVRYIGKSDIQEISRMDIAILRLLSGSEEIFNLAMFPMLMKPYLPAGVKDEGVVGAGNVIEFDPKNPQSKPEWLKTAISEPIQAVTDWINNLIEEMYKSINASGLNSSSQAKSGEALTKEFAALNAFLAKKAKVSVINTESLVVYFWLLWQGQENMYEDVSIDRPLDFDTNSLSDELDNYTVAKTMVNSETYQKNLQKLIARKTLPNVTPDDEVLINNEIDAGAIQIDLEAQAQAGLDIEQAS